MPPPPFPGGQVELLVTRSGEHVKIQVTDTGTGIAPEDLEKIREPFFTTKSKGTGFGLTVCHEIVTRHRGELTIESEQGRGTTVTVDLPIGRPRA